MGISLTVTSTTPIHVFIIVWDIIVYNFVMAQNQDTIWLRPFMWKTSPLLILLYKETSALWPFRGHLLWVTFPIPGEVGLHTRMAPLELMEPLQACKAEEDWCQVSVTMKKKESPEAFFFTLLVKWIFIFKFDVFLLPYFNYIV